MTPDQRHQIETGDPMKVREYKATYLKNTKQASQLARQLAFAGIAVVWVFKQDVAGSPTIPNELLFPTICFAVTLSLDLLQYLLGSMIWWIAYRVYENKYENGDDEVGGHSNLLPIPQHALFWLKSIAVMVGYYFLGAYLISLLDA